MDGIGFWCGKVFGIVGMCDVGFEYGDMYLRCGGFEWV